MLLLIFQCVNQMVHGVWKNNCARKQITAIEKQEKEENCSTTEITENENEAKKMRMTKARAKKKKKKTQKKHKANERN